MANRVATNGKRRDFTDDHAAACVRAKHDLQPITDKAIVDLIRDQGELFGVKFPKPPARSLVNNWIREAKVLELIDQGGKITVPMLRGRSTGILWAVLDRAESLSVTRPAEAAECVAVVARAAKYLEGQARVSQPPKPKRGTTETTNPETPGLERLRAAAGQSSESGEAGRAPQTVDDPSPTPATDQAQL